LLGRPRVADHRGSVVAINRDDESMVVVAVENLDVDPGIGHDATELAELAGLVLVEPLHEHLAASCNGHPGAFDGCLCSRAVVYEEVGDADVANEPHTASFNTDASRPQRFTHQRELAGLIGQVGLDVEHRSVAFVMGVAVVGIHPELKDHCDHVCLHRSRDVHETVGEERFGVRRNVAEYDCRMGTVTTTSAGIARFGALLADETRAEILCALMDGRAHTGSELSRHIGVAASTTSEHLTKLLDADVVAVEAQGRHRYWRLADPGFAELLEALGANATKPTDPKAPADLAHARTCYDHLAGEIAVEIYQQLLADEHLSDDNGHLRINPTGFDLLASLGADIDAIMTAKRPKARPCLDWTQRRHHLAGAAGTELLTALTNNGWLSRGDRPRSIRITKTGRQNIAHKFGLTTK